MNNKSGFSLVELLATIVILGILSTVGIIGVNKYFKNVRTNYYSAQEKLFISAGKEYFVDNKSQLPKEIGKSSSVNLSKLIETSYIKGIIDYKKKSCDGLDSYVRVQKTGESKYSYNSYLVCKSDNYISTEEKDNGNSSINIVLNTSIKNNPTASVSINEKNGIASYSYVVYRDNKEIKNTGNINNEDKSQSLKFTVSFNEFKDGSYSLKVISIDPYGNETTKFSTGTALIDTIGPVCGTINGASTEWTNGNRTISVACSDSGSGCKLTASSNTNIYSKTFTTTSKTGTITLYDNYNNSTNCSVNVYIDKDKPTCGDNNGSTSWTANNRTISLQCNDNGSGCVQNIYSNTFSTSIKTSSYTIRDKAGNSTSCPINIYVDKTKPTCTVTGGGSSWTNSSRTVIGTCTDGESGCRQSTVSQTINYNYNSTVSPGKIYDNVGNSTVCDSKIIRVDKTPPSVSLSVYSTNTLFNTTSLNYNISAKDSDSGIKYYCFSASGNCVPNSNKYSGTISAFGSYNGENRKFYGCTLDYAGNTSCTSSTYTVYNNCSNKTGNGESCGDYGECQCPDEIMYATKYIYYKDAFTSASCGNTTQDDGCSAWCDCPDPEPPEPSYNCDIRGSSIIEQKYKWLGSCGDLHTTGYNHYCRDNNTGDLISYDSNPDLVGWRFWCPDNPGWYLEVVDD